jgi:hypothetical protein
VNISDLLGARVRGPDNAELGVVVDVRLALEVLDEPEDGAGQGQDREESAHDAPLSDQARRDAVGRAVLVGLLIGPRGAGSFHGYERTRVRSPWPVPQLVRRRHRGTFLVRWEDVAAARPGVVELAPGYTEHDPRLD